MYNIKNFKILADLKEELVSLQNQKETILENKVRPALEKAVRDLCENIKMLSKEENLEVTENNNGFVAEYKGATIGVEIITVGAFLLRLLVDSEEVDTLRVLTSPVKYNSPKEVVKSDVFGREIIEIQNEIEEVQSTLLSYNNLKVIYMNKNKITFNTTDELIKQYFQ